MFLVLLILIRPETTVIIKYIILFAITDPYYSSEMYLSNYLPKNSTSSNLQIAFLKQEATFPDLFFKNFSYNCNNIAL